MEQLLIYGLTADGLVPISKVPNGLACGCTCPGCRQPLVAKNHRHNRKMAHFAHYSGTSCAGAFESALHLLAKEVFQKHKTLFLPDFHFDYDRANKRSLFRTGQRLVFDDVRLEVPVGSGENLVIADAVGTCQGREVLIEFAHTHRVDRQKRSRLKILRKACVEINLRTMALDEGALQQFFQTDSRFIYWVYNPKLRTAYMEKRKSKVKSQN